MAVVRAVISPRQASATLGPTLYVSPSFVARDGLDASGVVCGGAELCLY